MNEAPQADREAVGTLAAARGLLVGRRWAWWFSVALFAIDAAGNIVSFFLIHDAFDHRRRDHLIGISFCSLQTLLCGVTSCAMNSLQTTRRRTPCHAVPGSLIRHLAFAGEGHNLGCRETWLQRRIKQEMSHSLFLILVFLFHKGSGLQLRRTKADAVKPPYIWSKKLIFVVEKVS